MLGLIFIYFVGKAYYKLAEEHNKNKWLFAITGVLSYYAGIIVGGILAYLAYDMYMANQGGYYEEPNDLILGIIGLLLGLLTCWGYYSLLKKNWENKVFQEDSSILDEDFIDDAYSDDDILEEDSWK